LCRWDVVVHRVTVAILVVCPETFDVLDCFQEGKLMFNKGDITTRKDEVCVDVEELEPARSLG
jgi:hypothetical protein